MISLDPEAVVAVAVADDAVGDAAERGPHLLVRFLTFRQALALERAIDVAKAAYAAAIFEPEPRELAITQLLTAVRPHVVAVHVPGVADVGDLPDVLTASDLWKLFYRIVQTTHLTEGDRKKSGSP